MKTNKFEKMSITVLCNPSDIPSGVTMCDWIDGKLRKRFLSYEEYEKEFTNDIKK